MTVEVGRYRYEVSVFYIGDDDLDNRDWEETERVWVVYTTEGEEEDGPNPAPPVSRLRQKRPEVC